MLLWNHNFVASIPVYLGGFWGTPGDEGAGPGESETPPAAGGQHQGGQSHEGGLATGLGHGAHRTAAAAAAEKGPPQQEGMKDLTGSTDDLISPPLYKVEINPVY